MEIVRPALYFKVLHGQEAVEWCSPCLLRGGQTQIHMLKGDKQRKQFHTEAAVPEEVSKDKNLATTDRMKCPIKLCKSLMETNIWERI